MEIDIVKMIREHFERKFREKRRERDRLLDAYRKRLEEERMKEIRSQMEPDKESRK